MFVVLWNCVCWELNFDKVILVGEIFRWVLCFGKIWGVLIRFDVNRWIVGGMVGSIVREILWLGLGWYF